MSKLLWCCLSLLVCVGTAFLIAWPSTGAELIICDVGQGDAILITSGFTQVLIDGGPNDAVLECIGSNIPYWDRTIELVIATHPDSDHITGLVSVLKKYRILEIWDNGQFNDKGTVVSADFMAQAASQAESGTVVRAATSGDRFTAMDEKIIAEVIHPSRKGTNSAMAKKVSTEVGLSDINSVETTKTEQGNNGSIAVLLDIHDVMILLAGDIELEAELALVTAKMIQDIHILKISHHGAKTSSSPIFLSKSRPEIAIIGVGKENRYKHPDPEVIERLKQLGAVIVRTDELGTTSFHLENGVVSGSVLEELLQ